MLKMTITLVVSLSLSIFLRNIEAYDVISSFSFDSCNHSSYFDSLSHSCKSCGVYQKASSDHLSCECEIGYYPEFSKKSKTVECSRCDSTTQSEFCLKSNITCELYDIKGKSFTFHTEGSFD